MSGRLARRAFLVGCAALLAVAFYELWPDRRPNVIWISVGSLRPDRLSAYGYDRTRTPFADYLAANGVVFEQAVTDAPWTTAAMASSMTGRFAIDHGLRSPFRRLAQGESTVAGVLRAHGYATGAIVGSFWLDHVFRLDQGFGSYDDRYDSPIDISGQLPHVPSSFYEDVDEQRGYISRKKRADSYRSDVAVGDAAFAWLRRSSRMRPFFLWVHLFGADRVERPRESLAEATDRALAGYDASVARADAQIGRILGELHTSGRLARTIVVLQGDHGEGLTEHGELDHGTTLYDSVLRVPLIIAWPGTLSAGRVSEMVRNVDIAPTLLDLLGISPPAGIDGRSLVPLLEGGKQEVPPLLAETWLSAEGSLGSFNPDGTVRLPGTWRRGVRSGRWKYIRSETHPFINFRNPAPLAPGIEPAIVEELYEVAVDPREKTNVASQHPEIVTGFRRMVEAIPGLHNARTPQEG